MFRLQRHSDDLIENTESTVEENSISNDVEKVYSEEEFNKKLDDGFATKKKQVERRLRKEYEIKYGQLENLLKAGLGTNTLEESYNKLFEHWNSEGLNIPQTVNEYTDEEITALSNYEADSIINAGYDEIAEEVDRLASLGMDKMSKKDKKIFEKLANERKRLDNIKSLKSLGVDSNVLEDKEFKEYANMFNKDIPISKIYTMYNDSKRQNNQQIGSLKNEISEEEKTFYTVEEAKKLTREQYNDPKIAEAVRNSMQKWGKGI